MPWSAKEMDKHISRQSFWLRESWMWLLEQRVLKNWTSLKRPTALDVGCGPGHVMEALWQTFDVHGVDIDAGAVAEAKSRGLDAREADAHALPFEDDSFDIVYCSFLLMWAKIPSKVLFEMARVSRNWVVCLAEPDLGARIDFPEELAPLARMAEEGVRADGGDPLMGRKLRAVFHACGLDADIGVHPSVWGIDRLRKESEAEWKYLELTAEKAGQTEALDRLKPIWSHAVREGTLFQHSPVFYAFASKQGPRP